MSPVSVYPCFRRYRTSPEITLASYLGVSGSQVEAFVHTEAAYMASMGNVTGPTADPAYSRP